MKRNILILEDDNYCMQALVDITHQCNDTGAIFCASTKEQAYEYAVEEEIDLFLIDIILNTKDPHDASGMRFAENIRKMDRYQFTPIIFITSLVDECLFAFHNIHSYGYVEKPYDRNKLKELIESALKFPIRNAMEKKYIYYRHDGVIFSIEVDSIVWVEAKRRKLVIHTTKEDIEIMYKTCSSLLKELPRNDFIKCSRSTIVNRKFIKSIDKGNRYIQLENGTSLEIGIAIRKKFWSEIDGCE